MFYIEVGAHDGLFQSQTYSLEKAGWEGMLIEANPELFEKCKKNRGDKNIFVNACLVSNDYKEETITFYKHDKAGAGGRTEKFFVNEPVKGKSYEVTARTINDILKEHNIKVVDYFSIDTEGAEYDILNSMDFDQVEYKELLVEIHGKPKDKKIKAIDDILIPLGYAKTKTSAKQCQFLYKRKQK